jgi:hypothetical protein
MYNYTMKTAFILIFSLCVQNALAQNWRSWDNPIAPFDAASSRVHNGEISIDWRIADNVAETCDRLSKQFGNAGFGGQDIQGCAFWWGPKCIIVTSKKPTMHTVGHEIRHCFYGQWH